MKTKLPACILDGPTIARTIRRLGHELLEAHPDLADVVIVGIEEGGTPVADAVCTAISTISHQNICTAALDVAAFRDDRPRSESPTAPALTNRSGQPVPVTNKVVVLIDDVIQTGRTLRAALDAITSRGRPAVIESLVLIDRGNRELPLRPTYVGKNIPAAPGSWIDVRLGDSDAGAYVVDQDSANARSRSLGKLGVRS